MYWKDEFDAIRSRMLDYEASHVYIEDDDNDERRREEPVETLIVILRDACNLARRAKAEENQEYETILDELNSLIFRGIASRMDGAGPPNLESFAHTDDTLMNDPMFGQMSLENRTSYLLKRWPQVILSKCRTRAVQEHHGIHESWVYG